MRKRKAILFILLLFFFYMVVTELMGSDVQKSMKLCSLDGTTIEAVFDVRWQRHLLRPTELKGTIIVDGLEYISLQDTNAGLKSDTLIEAIRKKWDGYVIKWFMLPTNDAMDIHENRILVEEGNRKFDTVVLLVTKDGETITYYGPAETMDEAKVIEQSVYGR